MHATIAALLALHRLNEQRQRLANDRLTREKALAAARAKLTTAEQAVTEAQAQVDRNDALIRQYQTDITRCETAVQDLRTKQMSAASNKEYLACLNGIEAAKVEKKMREESLRNLGTQIDGLKAVLAKVQATRDAAAAAVQKASDEQAAYASAAANEAELDSLYAQQRSSVDAKFLEQYERLIAARHRSPLVAIDANTRSTPLGQVISHNQLEQLRLGHLVIDRQSNGILYIKDEAAS
jgi:predicted  nucleic acid-binding Zn-ribbon protein